MKSHHPDVPAVPATVESTREPLGTVTALPPIEDSILLRPLDEARFEVGDERARGGIGRILEAHDDLLGRRVALKQLLRPEHPATMARFMREAMITARLQHPSIVPIYDAGIRRSGEPYYTMPLVPGRNLHEAIRAVSGLEARLALLPHVQAVADAVAYAHDQGVVHRDLKPSNILVGPFGETVVIDWGLAKAVDASDPTPDLEPEEVLHELGLPLDETRPGVARGTPGYMSPEQARGERVDARSDVYALGAVLYHLLAGQLPHDTGHPASAGPPPPLAELEPRVPRDLLSIVDKAMAARPGDRYPSAKDFAVDLRRFATGQLVGARRYRPWTLLLRFLRRHRVTALAMLLMVVVTAAVAVPVVHKVAAAPACGGDEALAAEVWNPTRAADIRRVFEKVGGPVALAQWDRAVPLFGAYADRWAALRRESCQATRVRHVQSDSLFDRRQFCYQRRLSQLDSIVSALAQVDGMPLALQAAEIAADLPSLDVCAKGTFANDAYLPPLAQRAAVDAIYKRFDAARALAHTGHAKEAVAAFAALAPEAKALAYLPLDADLELAAAHASHSASDEKTAVAGFARAELLAARLGRVDEVFDAEYMLMRIEGYGDQFDKALARRTVLAALAELSPDPEQRALVHEITGTLFSYQSRYEEALPELEQALALLPAGAGSAVEDSVRDALGVALLRLKRYDEAQVQLDKALAGRRARHGDNHPLVAMTLVQLGNLSHFRGRFEDALHYYQRALDVQEALAGPDGSSDTAVALGNVAVAEEKLGRYDAALAHYDRALDQKRRFLGPKHREVVRTMSNRANVLAALGRYDEAIAAKKECLALHLEGRAPDDPALAFDYADLGEVQVDQALAAATPAAARSACNAALGPLDQAARIFEAQTKKKGASMLPWALVLRARVYACQGKPAEARAEAERTITAARTSSPPDPDAVFAGTVILAGLEADAGHAARALELLQPFAAEEHLADVSYRALALFVRARAEAARGHQDDGLALARQSLALLEPKQDARSKVQAGKVRAWVDRGGR